MKPNKSREEALFRSNQATEKANQEQSKLYNMGSDPEDRETQQSAASRPQLHESPHNLLQSWDTLRQLDEELELEAKKAKNEHNKDNESKV
jgi:hypothetical protein